MKKILLRIDESSNITINELLEKIEELQKKYPDMDVFFDGDEFAICGRPKKK